MKILWLTNYPLPIIAKKIGLPMTVNEGWLIGLSERILSQGYEMIFCVASENIEQNITYKAEKLLFYGICDVNDRKYNPKLKLEFERILKKETPDIVHIMGSEFPHSLSMYEACEMVGIKERCVVSIQGIISKIAHAYDLGIEEKHKKKRLVWDWVIKDSILLNKRDYEIRGKYEEKLFRSVPNVMGRTEWDFLCVRQINPTVRYFKCNEILREVFYHHKWEYDRCEKHSIIISQATYPVKGFHILLKAASLLTDKYPDLKIFVPSLTAYPKAMKRCSLMNGDYANYIIKLIKKYNLKEHIEFMGSLDAESMCKAYLRSNVFVCPSTIENSSNSLGEAMMLGMPIVASYVGGLGSMMSHGKEGFFFPLEEENILAAYIEILFENKECAARLGEQGRHRAIATHNAEQNIHDVFECYHHLCHEV